MAQVILTCIVLAQIFMVLAMGHEDFPGSPKAAHGHGVEQPQHQRHFFVSSSADPPVSALKEAVEEEEEEETKSGVAEGPGARRLGKHHHSSDESLAGGGVIIGGFATAIFAAVFCYIRVTRRKDTENPI